MLIYQRVVCFELLNHSWVLQFARSSAKGGSSWRLLPQILLYHIRNLAHTNEERMALCWRLDAVHMLPSQDGVLKQGPSRPHFRKSFKRDWLVVWNHGIFFFHLFSIQLGMSSSQLTNSIIFQRGRYTTNQENMRARLHQHWRFSPSRATAGQLHVLHLWLRTQCRLAMAGPRGGRWTFEYPLVN